MKSVTLRLQTTVTRTVGGEIRYLVFSVGSSAQTESASTLELEMKPPPPPRERRLLSSDVREALAKAIRLAKEGVAGAATGDPPLLMKSVKIDVHFAVDWDGSAEGGIKLVPVGLAASGRISRDEVQTVSLVFSP